MGRLTLGVETSCDETSVAVLDPQGTLRSHVIASQDVHELFGGVVPELAARAHLVRIIPAMSAALSRAGVTLRDLELIGATQGPGLIGSLLVGFSAAKALAAGLGTPFVGVHHLEAHLHSVLLEHPSLTPPWLSLIVSGGHTMLVRVEDWGMYQLLGETRDDAAGEAFDKVASLLGLGYPGGPAVEERAEKGDPRSVDFPRPMLDRRGPARYAFSFSGLKTAVVEELKRRGRLGPEEVDDLCAAFQAAVVDVLVAKTLAAVEEFGNRVVCLGGGVARNRTLREALRREGSGFRLEVIVPGVEFCTDNGAMVARTAQYRFERDGSTSWEATADPSLPFPGLVKVEW